MTRSQRRIGALIFACWLGSFAPGTAGQDAGVTPAAGDGGKVLVIGTKEVPPFAMKREDGSWEGISIDLWREIAGRLHLRYEFREMSLDDMLGGLAANKLDAAIGAITITADRQKKADFTHSYYTSGLGIAVRGIPPEGKSMLGTYGGLFTPGLGLMMLSVLLAMAVTGAVVWFFERKVNREHFGGSWLHGMGSGFWWSAATITSTGYGDKIPRSLGGRVVAIVWMFAGLIIISSFIATFTAALTVRHFSGLIRGIEDLPHHRVAVLRGTTSESFLRQRRVATIPYPSMEAAMQGVAEGKVDAFVYDTPLLMNRANQMQGAVMILPQTLDPQGYGIGLPAGSPLYKPIDITLLDVISDPLWQEIQDRYLGIGNK